LISEINLQHSKFPSSKTISFLIPRSKPKTSPKTNKTKSLPSPISKRKTTTTDRTEFLQQRRKSHKESIQKAMKINSQKNQRGSIRVDKLPHYRTSADKTWPQAEGFQNINVCSGAHGIWNQLSPMRLGPIDYEGDEFTEGKEVSVKNLENLWQFSKVWTGEVDSEGNPTKEFCERRKLGWNQEKGQRHVKKGNGVNRNVPLFSFWKGEQLSYLEARKEIYCPIYAELVTETKAFKKLEEMLNAGYNIQILGYDGYDVEGNSLEECFLDVSKPFGHELVLYALLKGNPVWEHNVEIE